MRAVQAATILGLLCFGAASAQAQPLPRIWDVALGTHVADLPLAEFVDPACGSNGGPPGRVLDGFSDFAKCAAEPSGLHEVTFIYDDEQEYMARAHRDNLAALQLAATQVLGQPVILSLLVDHGGLVQGWRIFTDPRAEETVRRNAYNVATALRARLGRDGWDCRDLPLVEGETPIVRATIKQHCEKRGDGRRAVVESRYYYKPGQSHIDPRTNTVMVNAFESSARAELVALERALARPSPATAASLPAASDPADLRAAFLAGKSTNCPGCDLSDLDLKRRHLVGANLAGANLARASFYRTDLRRANLVGANLEETNLNRANITFADLRNAKLNGALLYDADAARADFSGAVLSEAHMGKARLTLANFRGADLEYVDLGEARMNDAILAETNLKEAYMRQTILLRADLRGALVDGADLVEANLRGANLAGAKLRSADFTAADLGDANLTDADFGGAKLQMTNMQNTDQTGTNFSGALMPDNSRRP